MFVNDNIAKKDPASTSYGLDSNTVSSCHRALTIINQYHSMNSINKRSHPIPTKNIDHKHQGIKNICNISTTTSQGKIPHLRPTD